MGARGTDDLLRRLYGDSAIHDSIDPVGDGRGGGVDQPQRFLHDH